jgi:hypothetical protein
MVDKFSRSGPALRRIEAHVKWPIGHEGEATGVIGQLE